MITRVELGKVVSDAYANPEQFFCDEINNQLPEIYHQFL